MTTLLLLPTNEELQAITAHVAVNARTDSLSVLKDVTPDEVPAQTGGDGERWVLASAKPDCNQGAMTSWLDIDARKFKTYVRIRP